MPEIMHYNFLSKQMKFQGKAEKMSMIGKGGLPQECSFGTFLSKFLRSHLYFKGGST